MTDTDKQTDITIEDVVIIVKMSDGSHRQVVVNEETEDIILNTVFAVEGRIRVTETCLYGIVIEKS